MGKIVTLDNNYKDFDYLSRRVDALERINNSPPDTLIVSGPGTTVLTSDWTILSLTTIKLSYGSFLELDTINNCIVVIKAGMYSVSSQISVAANTTGDRLNGISIADIDNVPTDATFLVRQDRRLATANNLILPISMTYPLDVGDQVYIQSFQTSGSSLSTTVTSFEIVRV